MCTWKSSVDDAADARRQDLGAFPLPGEASFVHYVTGSPEAIRDIASAAGFRDQPAPGAANKTNKGEAVTN